MTCPEPTHLIAEPAAPDNALIIAVLADLLQQSHLMTPAELAVRLPDAVRCLGIHGIWIYLADLQQQWLQPMEDASDRTPPRLKIDSTLAGRAYQTISIQTTRGEGGPDKQRVWIPLLNGTERLGIMEIMLAGGDEGPDQAVLERCRMLASLAALIIASHLSHSDTYAKIRRNREMASQAEMAWAFMPPRTFATAKVILAASLEPAYEIGGDAFDHSLIGERLNVSLFDSVGHDLTAGLISSVAMAACRASRRAGGTLLEAAAQADSVIAGQFGESRFATALLCELDTSTGEFTWIPCGHPPPLLIRDGRVIKELVRGPSLPLGLNDDVLDGSALTVYAERLQPRDRILLYTDGVLDALARDGFEAGVIRLSDFVIRNSAEGVTAPETLRRLNQAILDYQHERLRDDATVVLLEWMPAHPERQLTV